MFLDLGRGCRPQSFTSISLGFLLSCHLKIDETFVLSSAYGWLLAKLKTVSLSSSRWFHPRWWTFLQSISRIFLRWLGRIAVWPFVIMMIHPLNLSWVISWWLLNLVMMTDWADLLHLGNLTKLPNLGPWKLVKIFQVMYITMVCFLSFVIRVLVSPHLPSWCMGTNKSQNVNGKRSRLWIGSMCVQFRTQTHVFPFLLDKLHERTFRPISHLHMMTKVVQSETRRYTLDLPPPWKFQDALEVRFAWAMIPATLLTTLPADLQSGPGTLWQSWIWGFGWDELYTCHNLKFLGLVYF